MSSSSMRLAPTTLSCHCGMYHFNVEFHSTFVIAQKLPAQHIDLNNLNIPVNLKSQLADPYLHKPGPIDILLGAEIFTEVFLRERINISIQAALHNTKFGWIIIGKCPQLSSNHQLDTSMLSTINLKNSSLALFTSKCSVSDSEEALAEQFFKDTVRRNSTERFVVKLPVKSNVNLLGDSKMMAQRRFLNLEKDL